MKNSRSPLGWNEERVQNLIAHYEGQDDAEAIAEDEAALEDPTHAVTLVPRGLVPAVRKLLAKHETSTPGLGGFSVVDPGFRAPTKRDRSTQGFIRVARAAGLEFLRLRGNDSSKTKPKKLPGGLIRPIFRGAWVRKRPNPSAGSAGCDNQQGAALLSNGFRKGEAFPHKGAAEPHALLLRYQAKLSHGLSRRFLDTSLVTLPH